MADFEYQQPQRFRATNKQRDEAKKRKSGSSGGIPDRWLDYLGVHKSIENTRFIAFKCPLKPELQRHLPGDRRFTLGDLVEKLDDNGKELGFIIDLTNTDRYYKATDITDAQIQYHKLMTPGHNRIPSEECYQQFVTLVNNFLKSNQNNDKLIGVHCTHGLNRTGYLIVRYMIEEMKIEPPAALEGVTLKYQQMNSFFLMWNNILAFNCARGHSMEKYTEDLLQRNQCSYNVESNVVSNSISTSELVNNLDNNVNKDDDDQLKWPTLYSTMEAMSLTENRQQLKSLSNSRSLQNCHDGPDLSDQPTKISANHYERNFPESTQQQRSTRYRQTTVVPQILSLSTNDHKKSIQTVPTYFGSGSNVGRGRPMTSDR